MSIVEKLTAIKDTIPHYWPIGSFIHHNPLKGFEEMNFKDALPKAREIFGGKVYMDASYYVGLYKEGKIKLSIFEKNLEKVLKDNDLDVELDEAKKFLMEISPKWESLRSYKTLKTATIDDSLIAHLKDELMPKYAKLIYQGYWFSPEREMIQAAIDSTQKNVEGRVKLKLYKGNVIVVGRESETSLFSEAHSTFEEDEVYNQKDAEGLFKLNALRFIIAGKNSKRQ